MMKAFTMDRRKFVKDISISAAGLYASRYATGCASAHSPAQPGWRDGGARDYGYELCYVPSYGQSLAMGERGSPAISTTQRFDSLMFSGGLLAQGYSSDLNVDYGSLVPLVEMDSLDGFNAVYLGIANPGETPQSGMFEAVKELMYKQDGIGIHDISYRFVGSCPGHGGYSIKQLSRGTVPYQRLIYEVQRAKKLATTSGLTFGVPCVTWMQGESDMQTPPQDYLLDLQTMFDDLNNDILAITGQGKFVQFIQYQTATPGAFGVAAAQYALTQLAKNVHIGAPAYFLKTVGSPWKDGTHLSALSYKIMGAYFGSAYKRLIINGECWLPLSPAQISASGNSVMIRCHVADGASLFADRISTTSTRPIKRSLGFALLDKSGKALNIDGHVQVTARDVITIDTPQSVTSGFVLKYGDVIEGYSGGNIRDDFGVQYVFDGGGLNVPMNNWLTAFSYRFP